MAIYSTTLAQLVERTCKLILHDWWSGTATNGSTSTVVDATRRNESDEYFVSLPYAEVYIITTTDGLAPQAEVRKIITPFTQSSGTITVSDNFSVAVGVGDTYSIHSKFKRDEVVEAINMAIDMVREEALFWAVDQTTMHLAAVTYEYALPTNFMYLYKVTMEDADGHFPEQIPPNQYKIIHAAAPMLHLFRYPTGTVPSEHYYGSLWADTEIVADRHLRLEGLVTPDRLTTDASTCPIDPAYIIFQAGALLYGSHMRGIDPDDSKTQATYWQGRADIERAKVVKFILPPSAKRIRE